MDKGTEQKRINKETRKVVFAHCTKEMVAVTKILTRPLQKTEGRKEGP